LGLSQFNSNPRQSTRNRNYFQPNIYLPGFTAQYTPNQNTTITLIISGIRGERNSVLFEGFADKMDTVNSATNTFANRSVDIDVFNSNTAELRLKHKFYVQNLANTLSLGLRGFNNLMWRRQLGRGTTGSDFDLTVIPNSFKRDLKFHSESIAFNVENLIQMTDRLSISPGFRYELGKTDAYGMISYSQTDSIPRKIQHEIPALGLAMEYRTKNNHGSINGGVSQAHRPVIFKDIIPGSALERTAYSLQDAKGYNAEVQYRNNLGRDQFNFTYSAGIYQTLYKNRMGNSVITDPVSQVNYIQKTNIGDSRTRGLEIFMKATYVAKIHREPKEIPTEFSLFNATAVQQAIYVKATAVSAGKNIDISGHQVEGVPKLICRTGLTIRKNQNQITLLHSYVSTQFSDALNTVAINNNGSIGQVPSYGLIDLQGVFIINKILKMRAGINNMLNKRYYTKRPTMYPGPGIWPSDGRGLYFGIEIKI
jgi:Fe(3+) dicitrate transport protein